MNSAKSRPEFGQSLADLSLTLVRKYNLMLIWRKFGDLPTKPTISPSQEDTVKIAEVRPK